MRISAKKRKLMTFYMMQHLHGKLQQAPAVANTKRIDKLVDGAGCLGSKLIKSTHVSHHNRRTVQ